MGRRLKIGPAEEREIWDRIEAGENLSSVGVGLRSALERHPHALEENRWGPAPSGRTPFGSVLDP